MEEIDYGEYIENYLDNIPRVSFLDKNILNIGGFPISNFYDPSEISIPEEKNLITIYQPPLEIEMENIPLFNLEEILERDIARLSSLEEHPNFGLNQPTLLYPIPRYPRPPAFREN